jgi:hypothetical protein
VSSTILSLVLIPSIFVWVESGLDKLRARKSRPGVAPVAGLENPDPGM